MKLSSFAAPVAFLVLVCGSSLGVAQTSFDRLEQLLGASNSPIAPAAPPIKPGYLGVIADQQAEAGKGVKLASVRPQSPAEKSGIQAGDLITKIGDQKVQSIPEMARILSQVPAGERISFELERNGQSQTISVTLGTVPAPSSRSTKPAIRPKLGVTVVPVTPQIRRDYQLLVQSGALIRNVTPGSPAAKAGLPKRSVIVAVDGISVRNSKELISLVQGTYPGRPIVVAYVVGKRIYRKSVELYPRPPVAQSPAILPASPSSPASSDQTLKKKIDFLEEELKRLRGQAGSLENQLKEIKSKSNNP